MSDDHNIRKQPENSTFGKGPTPNNVSPMFAPFYFFQSLRHSGWFQSYLQSSVLMVNFHFSTHSTYHKWNWKLNKKHWWDYIRMSFQISFLVQKINQVKEITRGGWSGFGTETVGIDPTNIEFLNGHPTKIPPDKILGGVVQNCHYLIFTFLLFTIYYCVEFYDTFNLLL